MAVLKKMSAATLMETMVATVLIVVIFMVSSLILNSLFKAQVKGNLQPLWSHVRQLEYQYQHQKIRLPFYEVWHQWEITLNVDPKTSMVELKANPKNDPSTETLRYTFYNATSY